VAIVLSEKHVRASRNLTWCASILERIGRQYQEMARDPSLDVPQAVIQAEDAVKLQDELDSIMIRGRELLDESAAAMEEIYPELAVVSDDVFRFEFDRDNVFYATSGHQMVARLLEVVVNLAFTPDLWSEDLGGFPAQRLQQAARFLGVVVEREHYKLLERHNQLRKRAGRKVDPNDDERDKWIYDAACRGMRYGKILNDLRSEVAMKGWGQIVTESGVRDRARAYAKRHKFPAPPPRQTREK